MPTPRKKWQTVAYGTTQSHPSESAVYRWISEQPTGTLVRIEVDENTGRGWQWYETVEANG